MALHQKKMIKLEFHSIRELVPKHGSSVVYMRLGSMTQNSIALPDLQTAHVNYYWESKGSKRHDYDPDNPVPPHPEYKLHYEFGGYHGSMSEGFAPAHKDCDVIWNYESVIANVLTSGMKLPKVSSDGS